MLEAQEALESLRKFVRAQRELHKEELAAGHSNSPEIVGRCKALKWAIDKISDQIKSLIGGKYDGDDDQN
jgi:hypothetical protein